MTRVSELPQGEGLLRGDLYLRETLITLYGEGK